EEETGSSGDDHADPDQHYHIPSTMRSGRAGRRSRADPLRSDIIDPSESERDRKPDQQQRDDNAYHRIGNLENRKDLSQTLRERPAHHRIRNGHAINLPPLQFLKE